MRNDTLQLLPLLPLAELLGMTAAPPLGAEPALPGSPDDAGEPVAGAAAGPDVAQLRSTRL